MSLTGGASQALSQSRTPALNASEFAPTTYHGASTCRNAPKTE